jgi:hypothetical protein
LLIQYIVKPSSGYPLQWVLGHTFAVNRSRIGSEGKELKGNLLKNRFRSPRSRKDQEI